jgi:hypothetical protein
MRMNEDATPASWILDTQGSRNGNPGLKVEAASR